MKYNFFSNMDIISHGLWGGIALGRKKRSDYIYAFGLSVLPDILAEGVMFSMIYLGVNNMTSLEHGHPNITEFPAYAQNFYNTTHSLIVFIAVFAIIWIIRKKPFGFLLAWAFHIIVDIPTHSFKLFPTPFLWPISDFKIDGIPWDTSIILIPNIVLLIIFISFWLYKSILRSRTMSSTCCKPHQPNQTKVCSKSLPFSTHYRQRQKQKNKKSLPFCKNLNADTHSNPDKNALTVDSETQNNSIFVT